MNSTISLSMIVKNESQHLYNCLNSVKNVVDEIVIVDTGSTDNTIEIAKSFNAKIFRYEWNDDFSAARNFALKNTTGNFLLYMDADEVLTEKSKQELVKLSQTIKKVGYLCTVKSIDHFTNNHNSIRYVRFFKNSDSIKFIGKVHEQITDSLLENNYEIIHSNIEILHYGYNISKEDKKLKAQRNLQLLLRDYNQGNKNAYQYFQIAQSFFILENYPEAEKYFNYAVSANNLSKDLKAECFFYLANINHKNFDIKNAELFILEAIRLNYNKPFYHYLYGKILQRKQDFHNSLKEYKQAILLNKNINKLEKNNLQTVYLNTIEVLFTTLNLSIKSNLKSDLSFIVSELMNAIKTYFPNFLKEYKILIESLLNYNCIDLSKFNEIIKIINDDNLNTVLDLIDNQTDATIKIQMLESLNKLFMNKSDIIRRIALIHDSNGEPEKAIKLLEENLDITNSDPSLLYFLASFYIKQNKLKKSLEIFDLIENKFPIIFSSNLKSKELRDRIKNSL